jgi:hypothetical protein
LAFLLGATEQLDQLTLHTHVCEATQVCMFNENQNILAQQFENVTVMLSLEN